LELYKKRNQEIQGDADKEISRLLEASMKAIKKINEDVVKEVKQLLKSRSKSNQSSLLWVMCLIREPKKIFSNP
jgi:hypothetical protein